MSVVLPEKSWLNRVIGQFCIREMDLDTLVERVS